MNIEKLCDAGNPTEFMVSVREYLDGIYEFPKSSYEMIALKPGFILENKEVAEDVAGVLKASGLGGQEAINEQMFRYHDDKAVATCYLTGGNFRGRDYVILFNQPKKYHKAVFAGYIGEEILHGEHDTLHGSYEALSRGQRKFSGVASEFIGSFSINFARELAHSMGLYVEFKLDDETVRILPDGKLYIDEDHMIGYQLGGLCIDDKSVDMKALFHKPDEKSLWKAVNEKMIPNLKLWIPKKWKGYDSEPTSKLKDYMNDLGLDCSFEVVRI
jgi:hypothetical protein